MRFALLMVFNLSYLIAGMAHAATTFVVPEALVREPVVLIAYGDMRFTNAAEIEATNPGVRQALVAKIAAEKPAAIFINGDIPWHGTTEDYAVYRKETRQWSRQHLRVYPALGNHEFSACLDSECLELWWGTFPALRGRRWYSVAIGAKIVSIQLDSDASLLPDSVQRSWLESQIAELGPAVRLVFIVMHHPAVADVQLIKQTDHNPRMNEVTLAEFLGTVAPHSAARFVVSAGHIHNYERFAREGVVYLVSGGGGARPYEIDRMPADLYQGSDFPNYHYVRFAMRGDSVIGEMVRLTDYSDAKPHHWQTRDRFEISLQP